MANVMIVTDSNAHLPPDAAKRLGVHVVPHQIQIGKRIYREGIDLTAQSYFRKLSGSTTLPVDLPPAQADFDEVYSRLHRQTDQIVSLHVSTQVNNTSAVARAAASNLLGRCQITVIDSLSVSVGLGILVETAATAAAAGTRLDDIVRLVRGMVPHLYGVFFVETLDYLERSKRISKAQAILGTMLGIKPLLNIEDGEIIPLEKVHTRERAVEKLVEFVGEFSTIERMAVVQHNFDPEAAMFVKHMAEVLPGRQFPVYTYSPSLAAHLGPSAIGVMVYEGRY